ncbi:MAG: enoyl-CoA hydratase/isomerase family protein [Haloarculaceae archaeon]
MSRDTIVLDVSDSVATVTIDDPDRYNPLTREAYAALLEAFDDVEASDARVLVIQGAGDAFSAGGDVEDMKESLDSRPPAAEEIDHIREHEQEAIARVVDLSVPTVAKVDGPATADGAALAVACDATLASERARLGFTHARFGLSLDAGASWLLPRLVGEKMALELAMTGRMVDAEEADELGLVNHVYPHDEFEARCEEYVAGLAEGPPLALPHVKRLVRRGTDRPLDEALDEEASVQAAMFATDDYEEGVRAFLEKRDPEFRGT